MDNKLDWFETKTYWKHTQSWNIFGENRAPENFATRTEIYGFGS